MTRFVRCTDPILLVTFCILSQQDARTNAILFPAFCRHKSCSTLQLAQKFLFDDLKRSIPICQTMEALTKERPEQQEPREPPAPPDQAASPEPQALPAQREQEPEPRPLYHKQLTTTVRRSPTPLRKRKTT